MRLPRNPTTASAHAFRCDPLTHALAHPIDLDACAETLRNALRLTELGARAALVSRLTGLDKSSANRLHWQVHGRPSPSGQTPFTDSWFVKSPRRMLHSAIVWRLYRRFAQAGQNPGRVLIAVYETYASIVGEPLLDVTRAAFVPRLLAMKSWQACECACCQTLYLTRVVQRSTICPGCHLYGRHRCRGGNEALRPHGSSR